MVDGLLNNYLLWNELKILISFIKIKIYKIF